MNTSHHRGHRAHIPVTGDIKFFMSTAERPPCASPRSRVLVLGTRQWTPHRRRPSMRRTTLGSSVFCDDRSWQNWPGTTRKMARTTWTARRATCVASPSPAWGVWSGGDRTWLISWSSCSRWCCSSSRRVEEWEEAGRPPIWCAWAFQDETPTRMAQLLKPPRSRL